MPTGVAATLAGARGRLGARGANAKARRAGRGAAPRHKTALLGSAPTRLEPVRRESEQRCLVSRRGVGRVEEVGVDADRRDRDDRVVEEQARVEEREREAAKRGAALGDARSRE